ncbi:hypothetical protein C8F04DRAFT_1043758 [Mycena alexandri]|uniref:Uncharacterized protein n=1 Tax=Mycena alexandri TaxID=1745969 RepID=A0AAD6SL36_9AGAR|nr:hypothetical protein C8F04DRAFT_1043758 [Mycena alexandri]
MSETRSAKEQLAAHFDKSATAVRTYADQFEASYARPALNTTSAFFDEYPISSTFIAIFSALAFFPVITFIALSLFTIVSLSFLGLCCAFVVSSAIVLFFLSILVLTLVTTFFASGFFTVLAISTYLAYRFVTLVRSSGRDGVSSWAIETKGRFIQSNRRDASDGSVVVDVKEPLSSQNFALHSTDSDTKQEGF